MNLTELQDKLFKLYVEGNYSAALDIASAIKDINPEMKYKSYFWRACLYCALEETSLAVSELNLGLKDGVWWNPDKLINDPDLQRLQELEEFKEILKQCKFHLSKADSTSKPESLIFQPKGKMNKSIPIIYAIHWRGENIKKFSQYWNIEDLGDDYVFAFPQSSQAYGLNEYCWDNNAVAKKELVKTFNNISTDLNFQTNDVILAGASQGGKLALELALDNDIPNLKGFIMVVPSLKEVRDYEKLIDKAKKRGVKGFLITGDQDHFHPGAIELMKLFKEKEFPCEVYVEEGMGHVFPDDFKSILPKAIHYILES